MPTLLAALSRLSAPLLARLSGLLSSALKTPVGKTAGGIYQAIRAALARNPKVAGLLGTILSSVGITVGVDALLSEDEDDAVEQVTGERPARLTERQKAIARQAYNVNRQRTLDNIAKHTGDGSLTTVNEKPADEYFAQGLELLAAIEQVRTARKMTGLRWTEFTYLQFLLFSEPELLALAMQADIDSGGEYF